LPYSYKNAITILSVPEPEIQYVVRRNQRGLKRCSHYTMLPKWYQIPPDKIRYQNGSGKVAQYQTTGEEKAP
jgi:hypothetical protein